MLYYGDYKNLFSVLPDKSVDLIVTDPPYLHNKGHGNSKMNGKFGFGSNGGLYDFEGKMLQDMNGFGEESISELLGYCRRVLKKMNAYFCCSENQILYYLEWAKKNGYYSSVLMWEKPLFIMNKNKFCNNVEFIIRIYEHGGTGLNRLESNLFYSRIIMTPPVSPKKKLHPTQKPVELFEQLILLSSMKGDLIVDPFMGSATCGVAALKNQRYFIGCEKEFSFYETARNRLNYFESYAY